MTLYYIEFIVDKNLERGCVGRDEKIAKEFFHRFKQMRPNITSVFVSSETVLKQTCLFLDWPKL